MKKKTITYRVYIRTHISRVWHAQAPVWFTLAEARRSQRELREKFGEACIVRTTIIEEPVS